MMLSTNREDAQRFMLRLRLGICMIKFFIILNFIFYINFSSVSESNDVEAWETPKSSLPSMPAPRVVSPVPSKTNASKSKYNCPITARGASHALRRPRLFALHRECYSLDSTARLTLLVDGWPTQTRVGRDVLTRSPKKC